MSAPQHVPPSSTRPVRSYESPPARDRGRPAAAPSVARSRPEQGARRGAPGPDAGYALVLARLFADRLVLTEGEHSADALAGVAAVAQKRAALFGRAPVMADLEVAATVWGLLDPAPPAELVDLRSRLFSEIHHPHHYTRLREVADCVPEATLRLDPAGAAESYRSGWASLLEGFGPTP